MGTLRQRSERDDDRGAMLAAVKALQPDRRVVGPVVALGLLQNFVVSWVLHFVYLPGAGELHLSIGAVGNHAGPGPAVAAAEEHLSPTVHYLRDAGLAAPVAVAVLLVTTVLVRRLLAWRGTAAESVRARLVFATAIALAAGLASVPEVIAHGWLFDEHVTGMSLGSHVTGVALITLRYTFALTLGWALLFGVPWRGPEHTDDRPPTGRLNMGVSNAQQT